MAAKLRQKAEEDSQTLSASEGGVFRKSWGSVQESSKAKLLFLGMFLSPLTRRVHGPKARLTTKESVAVYNVESVPEDIVETA